MNVPQKLLCWLDIIMRSIKWVWYWLGRTPVSSCATVLTDTAEVTAIRPPLSLLVQWVLVHASTWNKSTYSLLLTISVGQNPSFFFFINPSLLRKYFLSIPREQYSLNEKCLSIFNHNSCLQFDKCTYYPFSPSAMTKKNHFITLKTFCLFP